MLALDLAGCEGEWRREHRSDAGGLRVGADLPPVRAALPRAGLHGSASAGLVAACESGARGKCKGVEGSWGLRCWRWSWAGAAAPPSPRADPRGSGLWRTEAACFGLSGEGAASGGRAKVSRQRCWGHCEGETGRREGVDLARGELVEGSGGQARERWKGRGRWPNGSGGPTL